eukprot:Opistho-1_new@92670
MAFHFIALNAIQAYRAVLAASIIVVLLTVVVYQHGTRLAAAELALQRSYSYGGNAFAYANSMQQHQQIPSKPAMDVRDLPNETTGLENNMCNVFTIGPIASSGPSALCSWRGHFDWGGCPEFGTCPSGLMFRVTANWGAVDFADIIVGAVQEIFPWNLPTKSKSQLFVGMAWEAAAYYPHFQDNFGPNRDRTESPWDLTLGFNPKLFDLPITMMPHDPAVLLRDAVPRREKKGFIAYLSSNPDTRSRRHETVGELMKYLRIDSFGTEYHNKDPPPEFRSGTFGARFEAKVNLISSYRFTLAFENAFEPFYVTEKLFNPLEAGSVPIYFGAPNIDDVWPLRDSYINGRNFKSLKQLAAYVRKVDSNPALYERYLAWKKRPLPEAVLEQAKRSTYWNLCRACEVMTKSRAAMRANAASEWGTADVRPVHEEFLMAEGDSGDVDEQRPYDGSAPAASEGSTEGTDEMGVALQEAVVKNKAENAPAVVSVAEGANDGQSAENAQAAASSGSGQSQQPQRLWRMWDRTMAFVPAANGPSTANGLAGGDGMPPPPPQEMGAPAEKGDRAEEGRVRGGESDAAASGDGPSSGGGAANEDGAANASTQGNLPSAGVAAGLGSGGLKKEESNLFYGNGARDLGAEAPVGRADGEGAAAGRAQQDEMVDGAGSDRNGGDAAGNAEGGAAGGVVAARETSPREDGRVVDSDPRDAKENGGEAVRAPADSEQVAESDEGTARARRDTPQLEVLPVAARADASERSQEESSVRALIGSPGTLKTRLCEGRTLRL